MFEVFFSLCSSYFLLSSLPITITWFQIDLNTLLSSGPSVFFSIFFFHLFYSVLSWNQGAYLVLVWNVLMRTRTSRVVISLLVRKFCCFIHIITLKNFNQFDFLQLVLEPTFFEFLETSFIDISWILLEWLYSCIFLNFQKFMIRNFSGVCQRRVCQYFIGCHFLSTLASWAPTETP